MACLRLYPVIERRCKHAVEQLQRYYQTSCHISKNLHTIPQKSSLWTRCPYVVAECFALFCCPEAQGWTVKRRGPQKPKLSIISVFISANWCTHIEHPIVEMFGNKQSISLLVWWAEILKHLAAGRTRGVTYQIWGTFWPYSQTFDRRERSRFSGIR